MSETNREIGKQRSRRHLLQAASRLFRLQGVNASGISQVTTEAGLTNGAFYAHFASKQDLFKATITEACSATRPYWYGDDEFNQEEDPLDWLKLTMTHYLSKEHRDLPEEGCVVPTLAADVAREDESVKRCFERELGINLIPMQSRLEALGSDDPTEAWGLIALAAGGILLARAVDDTEMSAKILASALKVSERYLANLSGADSGSGVTTRPSTQPGQ